MQLMLQSEAEAACNPTVVLPQEQVSPLDKPYTVYPFRVHHILHMSGVAMVQVMFADATTVFAW